jgi:hypothetical protein
LFVVSAIKNSSDISTKKDKKWEDHRKDVLTRTESLNMPKSPVKVGGEP